MGAGGGFEEIEYGSGGCGKLLADLRASGVVLSIEGDGLAFDAPEGVLTDELLGRMRAHRDGLRDLVERFEERAAVIERDGDVPRAEAERLAWACVLGDPVGDDPEPSVDPSSGGLAPGGSSVPSSIVCPWCRSADLVDEPEGIRCRGCDRLAWLDLPGGGWERVDRAELDLVEVDPDSVPVCSGCGRLCDVDRGPMAGSCDTLGHWACSRCDPEADRRQAATARWAGLARRMIEPRAAGASRPVGESAHRDRLPESVGIAGGHFATSFSAGATTTQ